MCACAHVLEFERLMGLSATSPNATGGVRRARAGWGQSEGCGGYEGAEGLADCRGRGGMRRGARGGGVIKGCGKLQLTVPPVCGVSCTVAGVSRPHVPPVVVCDVYRTYVCGNSNTKHENSSHAQDELH